MKNIPKRATELSCMPPIKVAKTEAGAYEASCPAIPAAGTVTNASQVIANALMQNKVQAALAKGLATETQVAKK